MYGLEMIILGYEWGAQRVIYCVFFVHPKYIFSPARSKPDRWQSIPLCLSSSPAKIFLFYPLSSHSTPFAKDYLSNKFGIMDHVVLEWQMIRHWRYEKAGMSKLLQLQIFFINMSHMDCTVYLHERVCVCASVSSLYVGHKIMLVTRASGSAIVAHEFDWEVEHKSPIHQTSPIIYNFFYESFPWTSLRETVVSLFKTHLCPSDLPYKNEVIEKAGV